MAAPVLESPTNGQVTNDNTPNFNWADVSTATAYSLQVDNNNDFSSLTYSATPTNSLQNNGGPAGGFPDGTYFWRVASRSSVADGFGFFSSAFTFTVDTADPPAPVLTSPLNNAFINDLTPTFDWNDVSDPAGINRYTLEVATTSSFGATTFLTQQITTGSPVTSEFTPSSNLNGGLEGTYFWHVRARDSFNQQGVFSNTRSFTLDVTAPGQLPLTKLLELMVPVCKSYCHHRRLVLLYTIRSMESIQLQQAQVLNIQAQYPSLRYQLLLPLRQ